MKPAPLLQLRGQSIPYADGLPAAAQDGRLVEVGVGDGDKELETHQPVRLAGDPPLLRPQADGRLGQPLGEPDQQILGGGDPGGLAADP